MGGQERAPGAGKRRQQLQRKQTLATGSSTAVIIQMQAEPPLPPTPPATFFISWKLSQIWVVGKRKATNKLYNFHWCGKFVCWKIVKTLRQLKFASRYISNCLGSLSTLCCSIYLILSYILRKINFCFLAKLILFQLYTLLFIFKTNCKINLLDFQREILKIMPTTIHNLCLCVCVCVQLSINFAVTCRDFPSTPGRRCT